MESVKHLCEICEVFLSERKNQVLTFDDVFGPLETQIEFIHKFKIIARKWKLILELDNTPS